VDVCNEAHYASFATIQIVPSLLDQVIYLTSEALFKTLQYRPNRPTSGFNSLADGRDWVDHVVGSYNTEHKHSKLNFVTPAERHAQQDGEILAKRKQVLENAKEVKPNRRSQSVMDC
jgi:putative transposase